MSNTIDERVVEMRFDNKQFEAGVQTSLSTLDKLKKGLDLDGAAKGFDQLSAAAGKCDMSMLGRSVETVQAKFSAFEVVAMTALSNITNSAVNSGKRLIASLSVDQISAGWEKFGDKTTSVGTLVSQGYDLDTVNNQLERLNWFTDETSYNFTDMVSNIAKFTASGQDLETSVTALEGIANWAALSGQNARTASNAMYQLSQAMGSGIMRKEDYKSIQNASMDTDEFRQKALDAGVALGTLKKNADGTYKSLIAGKESFTKAQFADHLTEDAWFTSDVMMKVFNDYSAAVDQIYEYAEEKGITASQAIEELGVQVDEFGLKAFKAAQEARTFPDVIDSVKDAVSTGWMNTFELVFGNYEEAKTLWTDLANAMYEVFAEPGNARNEMLEEALSYSGWDRFTEGIENAGVNLDAFEQKLRETAEQSGLSLDDIISEAGSLEKAVHNGMISTDLLMQAVQKSTDGLSSEQLVQLRSSMGELTDGIDELSGRQHLVSAFWNTWEGVGALLSTVKDAFRDIFPATTSEQLYGFLKGLNEVTERFRFFVTESESGQKVMSDLKNTFKGLFAVLDIVKQAFSGLLRAVAPAGSAVGGLLTGVLGLTGSFGEWLVKLDEAVKKSDILYKGIKAVVDVIKGAITAVTSFAAALGSSLGLPGLDEAKASVEGFLGSLKEKISAPGMERLQAILDGVCTRAKQVRDAIIGMKNGIVDSLGKVDDAASGNKFVQVLSGIGTLIRQVASAISGLLGKAIDGLISSLSNADFNGVLDFLNALAAGGVIAAIRKFLDPMEEMTETFEGFKDWVKKLGGGITKILDGVRGSLEAWQTKLKSDALGKIAASIAVLSVSLLVLSTIDSGKVTGSLAAMGAMFAELMTSMAVLDKLSIDGKAANKMAAAMIKMGAALLVLSLAMKNIGELEPEQLAEGLIGVGVLLAEIDLFLNTAKFDKNASKSATGMILFAAAIKILASAVQSLGSMDWDDMAKGLIGVGVLLAEVEVFLKTAKFSGKAVLTATGIVVLASAIKILASACKDFGSMSWGEITKGLVSIAALFVEITAFTKLTGDAKHVISTGLALIEIAAAMKIFASAMADFGNMSGTQIAKGLVAMGGALAEVAIAVNLMPKNMVGIGSGLVIVGAALKVVASALGSMGSMSWEEIAKGLVAMGGALAELAIGLNVMNGTLAGSAALIVAAGALAILTPVLVVLGNMSWEAIAKGLVTIAGAFTVLGVAGAVLGPLAPSILALSGALTLLGVGSVAIGAGLTLIGAGLTSISVGLVSLAASLASSGTLIVGGLSAIVLGFAGLIPAIGEKIGEAIVAFCGIIANGAPAIGEAIKAVVLTLVDVLVECVPAIADGALQLVTGVLASLVTYTPQIIDSLMQFLIEILEGIARNMPQLIQAAMDVVGAFFAGVLSALSDIDTSTLIQGVAAIGLLTALVTALGVVAGLIPAAMVGVVGMGAVITELAIVLAAVGALAQIPGLEWLISEGGQLLQTIGNAIGGFVGGIVGGFMSGVSGSFPQIGADLSAFMTNVQPFIDGAGSISPDMLTGVKALTEAILLITAADLLESLTSWLTGGSSLSDFAEELVPFGEAMMKFSNTITGLDGDLVSTAAIAGRTLAEMAATLPNSGGVVGFFAGENDMGEFGNQLVGFGESMMKFADSIDGLDADAIQNAAIAGKAMAEMAATLPNTGGAVSFFTENNDMDTFGEQLVPFGKAIKEYSDAVTGLDVDAVTNSAIAGKALVELANTVPNIGGAVAFFTGDNDLATFGEQIVVFGKAMKEYSQTVTGLDGDAVANSATAGAALVELANTVPNTGGLVSFFTGDNDLDTFGEQLVPFGEAMKAYSDSITGFDAEAVNASATAAQALASLQSTLPNVGGVIDFFTGGNDLGKFAEGLIPFGEAMKSYGESVSGLEQHTEAIEASIIAGTALSELSKTLPNVGSALEFFTGSNDLGTFSVGIVSFGTAMQGYGEAVSGLEKYSTAIEASVIAGSSLIELSKTLPNVGGVIEFFTGANDLGTFSVGIVTFGKAMKDYGIAVDGLDKYSTAIEASVIAGTSLVELSKTLPNVGGVMEFFTGSNDLGLFSAGIVTFGEAMRDYGAAVAGLEEHSAAIEASVIAGTSLVELAKTLPGSTGVVEFFTGGNDLSSFAAGIVPFGEAMRDYGTAVAGLEANSGAIEASAIAGKALVELANTLPKCGGLAEVFTGSNSLTGFGNEIVQFGKDLSAYSDAIKNVKPEIVTASANAAQALSNLATGLPDSSLFDKWFGGDQTLASFGKDISSFGTDMGNYYSKVANIDLTKLSGVVTQVWSLVDLAKGIKGLDASGFSSFGNALKAMANTGISEFTSAFSNSAAEVNKAVQGMLNSVSISISNSKTLTTPGMESVMKSMADVVTQKAMEINKSVSTMMKGVADNVRNSSSSVQGAVRTVASNAVSALNSLKGEFNMAGQNAGQGFVNGINSKMGASTAAGRSLGLAALNAAKKALDSHSPSREFIYLGENMGEGLAIGAKNSIVPASQATSKMIDEVLKVSSKGIEAFQNWAEEKKYYGELSLKDELAGYENLQQQYKAGSEERIKIDREVYRIQNELVASTYQASIDWIEEEKYYNRLSTQEELEAYERMQKRYIEGSEERKKIDREVYTLRKQLMDESYQHSMDWIEEEKYYNRMSLSDELAAYKRVQSRYANGTDERKKMDREVYRLEQEIYEAQKQYIADVQRIQTEANQKRLDLEEEYADKVKSVNEKLASDIESLNEKYQSSLESRANSLYQSYGLFDEVKEREEVSGETLMKNLTDQVQEFGEWQDILGSLSARGLDSELVGELQEMGPSAIAQIKALNSMSDSELEKYAALWSMKHAQAREQAVGELEGLRIETQNNIAQLRVDAAQELDEYRATWQQKLNQVTIDANRELEELRQAFGEKVGLIKKDTEQETQEMVDAAQAILEEAGWDETGKQIVTGIKAGVEEEKPSFLDALTQMALEGVQAVKDTLDINSPSRVFQELGNYTGLGFVKGLSEYAEKSYTAGANVAEYATDGLSNVISTVSDLVNGEFDMQPTIRPVLDFSDVARGAGELNGMFNSARTIAFAGQTSLAFNSVMEKDGMIVTVDNDGVVQELRSLRSEMADMTARLERMQVVLDTGSVIGSLAGPMDAALGQKQIYKGRGI